MALKYRLINCAVTHPIPHLSSSYSIQETSTGNMRFSLFVLACIATLVAGAPIASPASKQSSLYNDSHLPHQRLTTRTQISRPTLFCTSETTPAPPMPLSIRTSRLIASSILITTKALPRERILRPARCSILAMRVSLRPLLELCRCISPAVPRSWERTEREKLSLR